MNRQDKKKNALLTSQPTPAQTTPAHCVLLLFSRIHLFLPCSALRFLWCQRVSLLWYRCIFVCIRRQAKDTTRHVHVVLLISNIIFLSLSTPPRKQQAASSKQHLQKIYLAFAERVWRAVLLHKIFAANKYLRKCCWKSSEDWSHVQPYCTSSSKIVTKISAAVSWSSIRNTTATS